MNDPVHFATGFLATVFANFDVSPEMSGIDHSSPGSVQQSAADPHYATDSVAGDEASRKIRDVCLAVNRRVTVRVDRYREHEPGPATGDRDAGLRRRHAERRHGNHSARRTRGKLRPVRRIRLQRAPRQRRLQVQQWRARKLCELPEQRDAAGAPPGTLLTFVPSFNDLSFLFFTFTSFSADFVLLPL